MRRTQCIFCGKTSSRAKEHIFSRTLLRSLDAEKSEMQFERRSAADDALQTTRRHNYKSFQSGGVCKTCNNGWMSDLEATVTPWVSAVHRKAELSHFHNDDRRLIFVRWALKTACVLDQISGNPEIRLGIPKQLFERQSAVPENIHVLVGFHDSLETPLLIFTKRNCWTRYPLSEDSAEPSCESSDGFFKVAFAINRLMVLVAGIPSPYFHLVIGTGVHLSIWPQRNILLHHWFYSLRTEGVDPNEALRRFSDLVAVARGGRMR